MSPFVPWIEALVRGVPASEDSDEILRLQGLSAWAAAMASWSASDAAWVLSAAPTSKVGVALPGVDACFDPAAAADVFAAAHHALSFGDWLLFAEPGSTAVGLSWILGAVGHRGWPEVARVQLGATELAARLGGWSALGPGRHDGQPFVHAATAAFVEASFAGLSPAKVADAVALAAVHAPRPATRSTARADRVLQHVLAVRAGRAAVAAIRGGVPAPARAFEPGGPLEALAGLRPAWGFLADAPALVKAWWPKSVPGEAWVLAAGEALDVIQAEVRDEGAEVIQPSSIARIDVEVDGLSALMDRAVGQLPGAAVIDPSTVLQSIPLHLAVRLLHGRVAPEHLRLDRLGAASPALASLAARIHVHHDPKASARAWEAPRHQLGLDRLLGGPAALAAALAVRPAEVASVLAGVPGTLAAEVGAALGEAAPQVGAAWKRLADVGPDAATADLAVESLSRLAGWATRTLSRHAGVPTPPPPRVTAAHWELPARVRVLLHGGRVREAEVAAPRGGPLRPRAERRRLVRDKVLAGLPRDAMARWLPALELMAPDSDAQGQWPGSGPADLLKVSDP